MYFFGNDEHGIYALLALDMLKDAYRSYNSSIKGAKAFLRSKGFSEEEIQTLIELSKTETSKDS